MNRLRTHKFKLNADPVNSTLPTGNNNNNIGSGSGSVAGGGGGNTGLLNKISKRYSTISSKITRRHHAGRKSTSPQKIMSGSYDMTGDNSEDHRIEIGAPILISTTTLDTDRFDVSEARLKQIGGGVAATNNTLIRTVGVNSSPQQGTTSSGSETEVYVDALCSTPMAEEPAEDEDDKFELALSTPKTAAPAMDTVLDAVPEIVQSSISNVGSNEPDVIAAVQPTNASQLTKYYEADKVVRPVKPQLRKKHHSKSAQNLHRSEMKVFLRKAPSMEFSLSKSLTIAEEENCMDLPKLPELYGASKCSLAPDSEDNDADKENSPSASASASASASTPSVVMALHSKSEPNTPMCPEQKVGGYLAQQQLFKSVDSLDLHHSTKLRSDIFASRTSIDQNGSKNSLVSHISSSIGDFDLKSASYQSLNAANLFVSIDELNEITRQINESEEFNREIDLEYCTHRDNLKPSERRITLLKNKNSRLISFNNNKEKIKKSWTGVKHWIGEESTKIKEVVQKQAAMQRMAGSKLNLSNSEGRTSPELRERSHDENDINTTTSSLNLDRSSGAVNKLAVSCDNIVEDQDEDLESSVTQRPGDDDTSPASKRVKREQGQNGFEELRRYIKQGGDFGKELILILQERVESEILYSKSLSKMANKLNKACRELPGSIAEAWRGVATEMENRSDIHRQLSASLTDEIVKPLKTIVEGQHKTRKSVETNVDKAARVLAEWRVSEAKAKKASHTAARENEKLQDAMLDVRIQKSPSIALLHQGPNKVAAEKEIKSAEKDCAKLDTKRKKAEEAVKRADVEYYTLCVRAERARVDWEMAVLRGSSLLQNIESHRLANMKNFVTNYSRLTENMNPIVDGLVQRLQPQVEACNVLKDIQVVKNIRRNSEGPSEQLLPDFYCEHTTLAMNRERRKHSLIKLLQLVKADLERERRSRNGLKGLSQSLNNQENQNITDKLYHIRSMLTYLEGARFKLHSALLELDHKPRTSHPLAQHIQITRDRTGLQQSILKVPVWLKNNDKINTSNGDDSIRDNEYDCTSQANTSSNVSCTDLSKDMLIKNFSRSKSNIETYSTTAQICLTGLSKAKTSQAQIDDPYSDRGQADGGSNQQDSDFDEFSSQEEDIDEPEQQQLSAGRRDHKAIVEQSTLLANGKDVIDHQYQNAMELHAQQQQQLQQQQQQQQMNNSTDSNNSNPVVLSRCKALYSYTPKLYDELELNPGDIIEVHAKQDDGWWLGALRNQVGIFPATYVEEFA